MEWLLTLRQRLLGSGAVASILFAILAFIAGCLFTFIESNPSAGRDYEIYEGVYWAIVTSTTVGYGDIAPVTSGGRCFAIVYSIISIPLFLYSITTFYKFVVDMLHSPIMNFLERLQADGNSDWKQTLYALAAENFLLFFAISTFIITLPLSAIIYSYLIPELTLGDAFYFVFITQLTIGYGDISPNTKSSRIFSIFLIVFMVVNLGVVVSAAVETLSTRVARKKFALLAHLEEIEDADRITPIDLSNIQPPTRQAFEEYLNSLQAEEQERALDNMRQLSSGINVLISSYRKEHYSNRSELAAL